MRHDVDDNADGRQAVRCHASRSCAQRRSRRMKYLEDIAIGERDVFGSHTFTAGQIKAFAARFDPQPFHLDEAAAARSPFGALCASGWHTASLWMCFMVKDRER